MRNTKVSLFRKIGSLIVAVLVLGAITGAALHAQLIRDAALYYSFEPDQSIAAFTEQTGMSDYGKFMFYASHPSLENADTFNQKCEKREKTAAVLGCYDGRNIYIYNIVDPRLEGIRPTTAAHEMLHVAYLRLSEKEKLAVDRLLEAEYVKLKDDEELAERMAFYAATQPGDQSNELHSIIGTEIVAISPALETHYQRYFSDRTKVIEQHKKYHSVFEELRARANSLSAQISQLEADLRAKKASYDTQAATIQNDIAEFNRKANQTGGFTSQSAFNAERQSLTRRLASLENLRAEIYNEIARYGALVDELNSITTETNTLNKSLDSSLEPAPSL